MSKPITYRVVGPSVVSDEDLKRVRSELDALCGGSQEPRLAVDLDEIHFVSSPVLGVFVSLHNKLKNLGGRLVFFNLNPATRRVLSVTQLDTILRVADDEAAAVSMLNQEHWPVED